MKQIRQETDELKDKELEVKYAIKQMLADFEGLATTLSDAEKYLRKALKLKGHALREVCLYILGNSIYWAGERENQIKKVIRSYAFNQTFALQMRQRDKKGRK